jgi:ribosomal protein S18 acetylase RimI-like enzyme
MAAILIRELGVDDWRTWRAMRQAALAEAPAAFGATLSEWTGDGDTEERWRARLGAVANNVLAELDGEAVGMVSVTAPLEGEVELLSMWVAPRGRGKGVGDALVGWVQDRARAVGAARVALGVRAANAPAIALYERHGFVDLGPAPSEGPHPERRMAAEVTDRPERDAVR